jgi:hypothetical protein
LNSSLAENEDYPLKACEEIIFKPFYTVVSPRCLKEKRILLEEAIAQQLILYRPLLITKS